MTTILKKANILPDGNSIKATDVFNAVFNALHSRPIIECIRDAQGVSYLNGIRTCYSKELKLVDCARLHQWAGYRSRSNNDIDAMSYISNCGTNEYIRFPNAVPNVSQNAETY